MWVTITLASLLLLLALVLCVPLDVTIRLDTGSCPKFKLRLVWLFGLIAKEVGKGKKRPKPAKTKAKGKSARPAIKTISDILRIKGLLKQFHRLIGRLISSFKIKDLKADLWIGLDNPADTGLLFAVIGPPFLFLDSLFPQRVGVRAVFTDEAVLGGCLNGVVRLLPIKLVMAVLGLVFSLPAGQVIKTLVRDKWRRKK